jgi:hypothetical protein
MNFVFLSPELIKLEIVFVCHEVIHKHDFRRVNDMHRRWELSVSLLR